ncbi:MAG TPA: hypothetical protein VF815_24975 [Myxococcaceae bacterium]
MPLKLHRSHRSYGTRLVGAWRFLTLPSTWLSLAALGLFTTVAQFLGGGLGALAAAGATWAYLFYVFMCAARGVEMEVPDFSSVSDITTPLFRGIVSSLFIWVPAVAYLVFSRGLGSDESQGPFYSDPIFLLILGWCLFYGPIAFMVAATNTSFLTLLNPVAMVSWAFKLGADYMLVLVAMAVCLGIDGGLGILLGQLQAAEVPVISRLIPQTLSLMMPFLMAHLLGLLLYVRGDQVGYGMEEDYYERVLPEARPEGQLPARTPSKAVTPAPGGRVARATEFLTEAPDASPAVAASADSLKRVADAITAKDMAGALSAYRELVSAQLSSLPAEQHLFVARAAATGGDFPLAAKAFETAADVAPNAPTAPQALVLLARLCGERMGDAQRAQSVYRYIVHRYPNTDASRFAAQRLPPSA